MKTSLFVSATAFVAVGLFSLISPPVSQSVQTDQPPKSRLGIIGQAGLVIRRVDPSSSVELAGLKVGDIVIGTSLGGDITSITQFQKEIAALEPGTKVQITYLRFNATTSTFDELKTTVTTIPFPSQARRLTTGKQSNAFAHEGFEPYNQSCAVGTRFTSRIDCSIINGRCRFYYCV